MKPDRKKLLLLLCAALILLVPSVRSVALPFFLAFFLAGCVQGAILALERRHIPRCISALLFLALFLAPLLFFCGYGFLQLLRGARSLLLSLLTQLEQGSAGDWLYGMLTSLPPSVQETLNALLTTLDAQKSQLAANALSWLGEQSSAWIASLPGHLAETGLFLLLFLFCAIGYADVKELLCGILPADWRSWLGRVRRELVQRLKQWCRAECKLVGLIFGELALGLSLLRIKNALLLGALIALVDLIPMVGSGLILLPWAALFLFQGAQIQALGIALIWLCVWGSRTLLEPKLVGRQLQIPTALSFFAAILGVKLWGLKGLILFPVFAAAAASLLRSEKRNAAPKDGISR